jgi:hypothetical protein
MAKQTDGYHFDVMVRLQPGALHAVKHKADALGYALALEQLLPKFDVLRSCGTVLTRYAEGGVTFSTYGHNQTSGWSLLAPFETSLGNVGGSFLWTDDAVAATPRPPSTLWPSARSDLSLQFNTKGLSIGSDFTALAVLDVWALCAAFWTSLVRGESVRPIHATERDHGDNVYTYPSLPIAPGMVWRSYDDREGNFFSNDFVEVGFDVTPLIRE